MKMANDQNGTTPDPRAYALGFRDGLAAAHRMIVDHQKPDEGNLERGAKNRVLKRIANKIHRARREQVTAPTVWERR